MPAKLVNTMAMFEVPDPNSGWTVPVTGPSTRLVTQTGTPPPEIGRGAPKKKTQLPPLQSPSLVHGTDVSFWQRWLSTTVVLAIGPLSAQSPHCPRNVPAQSRLKLREPPVPSG